MSEQFHTSPQIPEVTANNLVIVPELGDVEPVVETPSLTIRHETFENARHDSKKLSDGFIDSHLEDMNGVGGGFRVGSEKVGLKGFLDKVPANETDQAIIDDPEAIAAVYLTTTDMIARNLKIKPGKGTTPARRQEIADAKATYIEHLGKEAPAAADQIVEWATGFSSRQAARPAAAFEYRGFNVVNGSETIDAMDKEDQKHADFHPNINIQRQAGGSFIFGYSDSRITQRMNGQREPLTDRIYLNPQVLDAPQVFESILQAANQYGIPLEMKLFQRAEEMAVAHIEHQRDNERGTALRGDGVVIYAPEGQANDILALALAIAQDNPTAFKDRQVSRMPQPVADGIAIGSEPKQRPGHDPESLTQSRIRIMSLVASKVIKSGKTGQEARDAYRRGVAHFAEREGIDPNNIAFNQVA